ncbi:MAG: polysaccharide deacetylase family protein [Chitinophagales bacterium]|nr:polysaccharide deacetylase family protein [Chitinophagales bacterium]MDW8394355.1 polysaccharide deacetylase family protein [Chitinophagales bacterium]
MFLIYADQLTPRLEYVLHLWFGELLHQPYRCTTDVQEFIHADAIKINYSRQPIDQGLTVLPHGLLQETGVRPLQPEAAFSNGTCRLFTDAAGGYDPFAATFFLVTRYEEYLPHEKDRHGRFPDEANTLVKLKAAHRPVVQDYVGDVLHRLAQRYRHVPLTVPPFRLLLTYDVDLAFAYLHRPWWRTAAAYARSLLQGDLADVALRSKVLSGKAPDPFDTFAFQRSLHQQYGLPAVYFFLLADYGRYHKNVSWTNVALQQLIRKLRADAEVGLHAGYSAGFDGSVLHKERQRLQYILDEPPMANRFHFLRMKLPESYRLLLQQGFSEDYSLGFTTRTGFRAGMAQPFTWYDVENESHTALIIHPMALMDATLYYHLQCNEQEVLHHSMDLVKTIKQTGGELQLLLHNDLLSGHNRWKTWPQTLSLLLQKALT